MHYGCDFEDEVVKIARKFTKKTFIWNLMKQKYYSGPTLPMHGLGKGCPISLNRTHVLRIHL